MSFARVQIPASPLAARIVIRYGRFFCCFWRVLLDTVGLFCYFQHKWKMNGKKRDFGNVRRCTLKTMVTNNRANNNRKMKSGGKTMAKRWQNEGIDKRLSKLGKLYERCTEQARLYITVHVYNVSQRIRKNAAAKC